MRKVLIAVALLFTVAVIGVGGFLFLYTDFTGSSVRELMEGEQPLLDRLLDPKRRFLNRQVVEEMKKAGVKFLTIPKGHTFSKAADLLEQEGIITSALLFRTFARFERGQALKRGIKAGDFGFHPAMKPAQVFDVLFGEPVVYVERVTIPEGFNLREIAARLEAQNICKKSDFLKAAYDKTLLQKFGIPGDRMEGYLFPDTYEFRVGEKPEVVIARMYQKFKAEWLPVWEQRAREMGLDRHKAVTIASIIEKETGQKAERELVSSVFHNRRRLAMPLQTDPTTCYAIMEEEGWPDKKCDITSSNKLIRNPYNTYWVRDLPPGPIASPGRDSLRAAVFPAQSKYLFFVSRNDGTHIFSERYGTHAQLVKTWQQDYFRARGGRVTAPSASPEEGAPAHEGARVERVRNDPDVAPAPRPEASRPALRARSRGLGPRPEGSGEPRRRAPRAPRREATDESSADEAGDF
jgi:UPF0755 protein